MLEFEWKALHIMEYEYGYALGYCQGKEASQIETLILLLRDKKAKMANPENIEEAARIEKSIEKLFSQEQTEEVQRFIGRYPYMDETVLAQRIMSETEFRFSASIN
ncbi:MAG: hypothetical protein Q4F24_17665 [Eubacteriales bacterium]|nr:hypothetical protein [Eubacteriales bacterium]